jgi:uncharacterized protein YceH (UPF0502 family)
MLSGSRVEKFRHVAREVLDVDTNQLVILAELLLRGPQTVGELRGRASRMSAAGALDSIEIVKNVLDSLMARTEPLARELPPAPGDRAPRFAQLLCPNLHPVDSPGPARTIQRDDSVGSSSLSSPSTARSDTDLLRRVQQLESEVAQLRRTIQAITQAMGVPETSGTAT